MACFALTCSSVFWEMKQNLMMDVVVAENGTLTT